MLGFQMIQKKELADRPDFDHYAQSMNATMRVKWNDIEQYIVPGKIIDVGCGTGELTRLIGENFPNSHVIGLDMSDHFVHLSRTNAKGLNNVEILQSDVLAKKFDPGTITTKIFSSIMHELASYNGYDKEIPKQAIRQSFGELQSGGRIIIRDGISPGVHEIYMWLNDANGMNELDPKKNLMIDIKELSTEARFIRFCLQFKGREWEHQAVKMDEMKLYKMDAHFANEFMSKKEYVENWNVEILEEFGTFTFDKYKRVLEVVGFELIEIRMYRNPWILQNWYEDKLKLFKNERGKLTEIDYFPTNILIVGEKPRNNI